MTSIPDSDLLGRVEKIQVNSRHGRRSPHKPLLLLLSFGRHLNGAKRLATFGELEGDLNRLIRRFGLPDSRENAHYPFWHLRNDGLWEIDRPELVRLTTAGNAYITDLREHGIRGGLPEDVRNILETSPRIAWRVVQSLLDNFFPPSLHDDVLRAVGLDSDLLIGELALTKAGHAGRDRRFREIVLAAYESMCAVCEFDVHIDEDPIGLEAAHIKWHSANGPARVCNGMALCVLHHKFFDAGLFTVLPTDFTILVGGQAGGDSVESSLNRYGGLALRMIPERPGQRPAAKYLEWHRWAVFKAMPAA